MSTELCTLPTGDGCGGLFVNKSTEGLCAKCTKLSELEFDSEEYRMWKVFAQCGMCGVAWKNLASPICGKCSSQGNIPTANTSIQDNLITTVIAASRNARNEAADARLHGKLLPTSMPPPPVPTQNPLHTTSGLLNARSNQTADPSKIIMITFACRIKSANRREQNTTDADLASWCAHFPRSTFLTEVLEHALGNINQRWSKTHGMSLILDEVELRYEGNRRFVDGIGSGSVGDAYDKCTIGAFSSFYNPSEGKGRRASGGLKKPLSGMTLEVFIDKISFLARKDQLNRSRPGPPSGITITSTLRNRKRSATESTLEGQERYTGYLQSSFLRTTAFSTGEGSTATSSIAHQVSNISFIQAETICDANTGLVEVMWPNELDEGKLQKGKIGSAIFASGATKQVYQLAIASQLYVAKRFFDIGSLSPPTSQENHDALEKELIRLKSINWLLNAFKSLAKKNGIEISTEIVISEGFLIQEVGNPSIASGLSDTSGSDRGKAFWLVEPRRTKTVIKYTGTLQHPNRKDKIGITLLAFSHFVYNASKKDLVLADIQGSQMVINGVDSVILFDLMTHSPTGDSGIGDYGEEGIGAFTKQHICNRVCKGLNLPRIHNNVVVDESDEDGEDVEENESD